MRALKLFCLAVFLPFASAAWAQEEERPFCSDRPGVNTPPCTMVPGQVMLETSFADWELERGGGERTDTFAFANTLVRVGVIRIGEAQIGWTPLGHVRERVSATGPVGKTTGVGDLYLAWRQSLTGVRGPVAVQGFVTLPIGADAIGAGTWTAGVLLPVSFDLTTNLSFAATPQVSAEADEDGDGRHLFYGTAAGLSFGLSSVLGASAELSAFRDNDPAGDTTQIAATGSVAWQIGEEQQVDAQVGIGLNRDTPDVQVIVGLARRF